MDAQAEMVYSKEEHGSEPLKFHIRLRVFRTERNFGPGVAYLMERVRETESLSAACKEMHMAYSKAWKILHRAEEDLGFPLVAGRRGGERGGTTVLTREGEAFLLQYRQFAEEVERAAEQIFKRRYGSGQSFGDCGTESTAEQWPEAETRAEENQQAER